MPAAQSKAQKLELWMTLDERVKYLEDHNCLLTWYAEDLYAQKRPVARAKVGKFSGEVWRFEAAHGGYIVVREANVAHFSIAYFEAWKTELQRLPLTHEVHELAYKLDQKIEKKERKL